MSAGVAALLVEFRAGDAEAHRDNRHAAAVVRDKLTLVAPVASVTNRFTEDAGTINMYWHARQAFMTAVGKARPTGTTLITEDFAVLPSQLADACVTLSELQRNTASTPPLQATRHTATCTSCSPSTRPARTTSRVTRRSWRTSAP